ncbi:hypothetical protein [Enterobacter kobei]
MAIIVSAVLYLERHW